MECEKIVISKEDIQWIEKNCVSLPEKRKAIPFWLRFFSALLILFPPLLFLVTFIVGLIIMRYRDMTVRYIYAVYYCVLLFFSGILWSLIAFVLVAFTPSNVLDPVKGTATLSLGDFPSLPSDDVLAAKDIAQELMPLVVVVRQVTGLFWPLGAHNTQSCSSGSIVWVTQNEAFILTSRHGVDTHALETEKDEHIEIMLLNGQKAKATIAGIHRTLDLALLRVPRKGAKSTYIQPIRDSKTFEVGEQIYVIGHPEGFLFSISAGLVAQVRSSDLIQISAPISPGNSGGPIFDSHGRLVAIVQSIVDKAMKPNAENLNFAVRADDLLNVDAWTLSEEGQLAIDSFVTITDQRNVETRPSKAVI